METHPNEFPEANQTRLQNTENVKLSGTCPTSAGLARLKSRAFLEGLYRRVFFLQGSPSVAQPSNEILRLMPEGGLN